MWRFILYLCLFLFLLNKYLERIMFFINYSIILYKNKKIKNIEIKLRFFFKFYIGYCFSLKGKREFMNFKNIC